MKEYTNINLIIKDYKFLKDVGMGSFTKVIKAKNIKTN